MTDPEKKPQDESLADWEHNPSFQQSPVDHFAPSRLPDCSRRRATLLAIFLGFWGIQRFYLRRPALGWVALVSCKGGLGFGLLLWFLMGDPIPGIHLLIGGPVIAELIGIADAVALQSGTMTTDGVGKPLAP